MDIYLIRHGRTPEYENGLTQRHDSNLSEDGRKWIEKLKPEYKKIKFDKIYHSPWPRARQTAEILFSDIIPIEELDYIHEYRKPLALEGIEMIEADQYWRNNWDNLLKPQWRPDDGESFNDILARVKKLTDLILSRDNSEVLGIVGHGTFFRHLLGNLMMGEDYNTSIFHNILRNISMSNGGYMWISLDKATNKIRLRQIEGFSNLISGQSETGSD